MARADTYTILPLDQWAQILGINPWIFNQFDELKVLGQARSKDCQDTWYQFSWNGKFLSREEVAYAIASAEGMIAEETSIWPGPVGIEREQYVFRQPRVPKPRSMFTLRGAWKEAALRYLNITDPGVIRIVELGGFTPTYDLTDINLPIQLTWPNTEGYAPDEVRLFYAGGKTDLTWEIRPVQCKYSDPGNSTELLFTVPLYMLADPAKQNLLVPVKLDPKSTSSYLTDVFVYRVYIDNEHSTDNPSQGEVEWLVPDGGPYPLNCINADCQVYRAPMCLQNDAGDDGVVGVQIAQENWPSNYIWGAVGPQKMYANYVAGMPLQNRMVQRFWAEIVTKLACGLLPSEQCGCDRHNAILRFWRMLPSDGAENIRPLMPEEITNPFGPSRGGIFAWQRLQGYMIDATTL